MIALGVLAAVALRAGAEISSAQVPAPGPPRDRAIAELHGRAEGAAPGSHEAGVLAGELERFGSAYLAEGDTGRASELLSEAYALDEENGLVLAELTLCYLRAEEFDAARFYLRRAQERVTHAPPEIYGVLGDVYFGLHRLDDAVFAWEDFVRFGGSDPALLSRLARARQELAVSRGQRSLTLDHFTLYADPGVDEGIVEAAGADLEAAYPWQSELLGAGLAGRQVVVLYGGRAYFSLVSVPDWSSGLFDGKIRISVEPGVETSGALAAVLRHELAHALLRQSAGDRLPGWFHEGLAQWCEGRRIPVREIREAVGPRASASAQDLNRALSGRRTRAAARSSYSQALSIVEYLVAAHGPGAISCLVEATASRGSFGDALISETGLSEEELFARWRRWAQLPRNTRSAASGSPTSIPRSES